LVCVQLLHFFADGSFPGDRRPDYRWIIIGPKRSGSNWHIDPNATSLVFKGSLRLLIAFQSVECCYFWQEKVDYVAA
jgi:hypothetical protein